MHLLPLTRRHARLIAQSRDHDGGPARELLLSRRHSRLLADNPDAPPRDYAEEPQPFEAQPMFDLCEAILIGGMVVTLGAVLIWHAVRLLWS